MRFHKFELSPSGIDLRLVRKNQVGCRRCFHSIHQVNAETNSRDKPYGSLRKISVNYLSVPFSEHFEQPATIAQRVNGLLSYAVLMASLSQEDMLGLQGSL